MRHTRVYVTPSIHVTGLLSIKHTDTLNHKSYQHLLTDRNGQARRDGIYRITFRLHDSIEGGMTVWSELHSVDVRLGIFTVDLGLQTPLELPFDREYFLSIQWEDEPELSKRISLYLAGNEVPNSR